ncbi:MULTISPECIES: response regulator transcription factor [Metasolibacillus]|uniref:response regulator transcription factor n=1 Tax=Metasolibacillus TaxID=2703677 RepID=UPI000796C765|nr:response regulator transcription factor [Metasolibacillus fluoroglycofenilyticus]KYG92379.1 DNA-binding response regulator [[Bacillus] sp. KCTC 13219]
MRKILVVDDDQHILQLVKLHLQAWHYDIICAANGVEALQQMTEDVDLAVVDVMMPEMDGLQLTKELKEEWEIPVLLLTAKGQLEDKREGFTVGADDYVVKPFEPDELLFRIQAILRRYDKPTEAAIEIGDLVIDRRTLQVVKGQTKLVLPLKEFELLAILASRAQIFQRDYLMEQVWGLDYESDDTLNTHIKRLREKLVRLDSTVQITTVRGVGYQLEVVQ